MIFQKLIFHKHLEEGEEILFAVHKHWIEIFKQVLEISFFGFAIPWGLYLMGFNTSFFFWAAVLWSAMAYIRFLYVLTDWYADVWLITNMSVINIEWNGFFNNIAGRTNFNDIEGAAYEIKGFWGTMLRYGDMALKVMSGNNLVMKNVTNPKKAELAIAQYQDKYMNDREMQDSGHLKELLSDMIAQHMRQKLK